MTAVIRVFLVLAIVQSGTSLIFHLAALTGRVLDLGISKGVAVGVLFAVWLIAVLVSNQMSRDEPRGRLWSAALANAPAWLRRTAFFPGVYAIGCLVVVGALGLLNGIGGPIVQSAYYFAFSYMAVAILSSGSAARLRRGLCPSGHPVSRGARFCEQCGVDLAEHP